MTVCTKRPIDIKYRNEVDGKKVPVKFKMANAFHSNVKKSFLGSISHNYYAYYFVREQ